MHLAGAGRLPKRSGSSTAAPAAAGDHGQHSEACEGGHRQVGLVSWSVDEESGDSFRHGWTLMIGRDTYRCSSHCCVSVRHCRPPRRQATAVPCITCEDHQMSATAYLHELLRVVRTSESTLRCAKNSLPTVFRKVRASSTRNTLCHPPKHAVPRCPIGGVPAQRAALASC